MNHNHRLLNRNIILVHISLSINLSVFTYNMLFGNKKTDDLLIRRPVPGHLFYYNMMENC
jgi:hypothetical protein